MQLGKICMCVCNIWKVHMCVCVAGKVSSVCVCVYSKEGCDG